MAEHDPESDGAAERRRKRPAQTIELTATEIGSESPAGQAQDSSGPSSESSAESSSSGPSPSSPPGSSSTSSSDSSASSSASSPPPPPPRTSAALPPLAVSWPLLGAAGVGAAVIL